MAMALKRVRTPHYLNGFGEGQAVNRYSNSNNAVSLRNNNDNRNQHQHQQPFLRQRAAGSGQQQQQNRNGRNQQNNNNRQRGNNDKAGGGRRRPGAGPADGDTDNEDANDEYEEDEDVSDDEDEEDNEMVPRNKKAAAAGRKRGTGLGPGGRAGAAAGGGGGAGFINHEERLAAQEHPALINPAWRLAFDDLSDSADSSNNVYRISSSSSAGGGNGRHRHQPGGGDGESPSGPFQLGTLGLLFSVVVLSALFLHIIADAQKSMHGHHRNKKHRSSGRIISASQKTPRKKKTDEWSGDDNYDLSLQASLLSDMSGAGSVGGAGGGAAAGGGGGAGGNSDGVVVVDTTDNDGSSTPVKPVYYAYQHAPGQHHHHQAAGLQQHRHRKMSAASAAAVSGQQQQQQPSGVVGTVPQQPQQQQPESPAAFHQRNYYLNQSGGAAVVVAAAAAGSSSASSSTAMARGSNHGGLGASSSLAPRPSAVTASPAAAATTTTPSAKTSTVITPNKNQSNYPTALPLGTPVMPHLRPAVSSSAAPNSSNRSPAVLRSSSHLRPLVAPSNAAAAGGGGGAPPPQRLSSLYPQPLSSASSFDSSIVEHPAATSRQGSGGNLKRDGNSSDEDAFGMGATTPIRRRAAAAKSSSAAAYSPRVSSPSFDNKSTRMSATSQQPASHLLLSPGTDDVRETLQATLSSPRSKGSRRADLVEQTPRAGNLRPTKNIGGCQQQQQQHGCGGGGRAPTSDRFDSISVSSETFKFASPPMQPRMPDTNQGGGGFGQQSSEFDDFDVPFIPSLEVHVAPENATPRPLSVNLDDLHLFQMMESGNVSHWTARLAAESRLLQQQSQGGASGELHRRGGGGSGGGDFLETESSVASSDVSPTNPNSEIPSNDPRKSILHKRSDLTISTDAAASLQSAIAFKELRLVEVIGGGGFGQVWKAVWRGTPVAVKVLTGSAQSKNVPKAVLEEFVAEINLLKGMRHPNICLYMGACLDPPNRAIITELAANGSLWDALRLPLMPPFKACDGLTRDGWPLSMFLPDSKHGAPPVSYAPGAPASLSSGSRLPPPLPPRGSWPWHLVKRVACGAARGMAYLHSGKPPVLHRDLKSANILLDDSYTAKVCDFGLSRIKSTGRSMTGNCGTVQWMAPEVLANMSYNEKADVYSFGIICWELLSRQCPFEGMTAIQCALSVLNRDQRPEIPKWCPPSLHALIRACIKKDPDERPSFEQVLLALDSVP